MVDTLFPPSGSFAPNALIQAFDSLIAEPTIEPLDLEEVKKHLRFTSTSEDTLIDLWISAARGYFEEQTGRQLMAATWEYRLDGFPYGVIELPHPPLLEVLTLNDEAIDDTVYTVEAPRGPHAARGLVMPFYQTSWPSITGSVGAVRVRYRAGYGEQPGAVPELVKAALLMLVGHFHKFRAETHEATRGSIAQIPLGAKVILDTFRYSAIPVHPLKRW